jgi:hypothetical protein
MQAGLNDPHQDAQGGILNVAIALQEVKVDEVKRPGHSFQATLRRNAASLLVGSCKAASSGWM